MALSRGRNTNDCDDKLANAHGDSSPDEQGTPSKLLNHVKRCWCGDYIDDIRDGGYQESVLDTNLLEERGAIVD